MSVKMTEEQFGQYGKCVFLDNGSIRLGVTVDIGPRIVYFSVSGMENIMFKDDIKRFSEKAGDYGTWYAYGGHRLWCSPEINPETYYPDNDKVAYTFEDGTLTLTPPDTPFGKRFSMSVTMSPDAPLVKLVHKIKNISDKPSTYAAWSITSMTDGGTAFIPFNTEKTGYLPNRTLVMWDYTDVYDPRFELKNNAAFLKQDTNAKKAFKIGINSTDGYVAYTVHDQTFVKSFDKYKDLTYPDFGCNAEVYTNSLFLECETLGEIREFAPGETAEISEEWRIFRTNSKPDSDPDTIGKNIISKINSIQ